MSIDTYIQSALDHIHPFTVFHKSSISEYTNWSIIYSIIQKYAKMPYIIIPSSDNESIIVSYIQNPKRVRSYEDVYQLNYII